MWQECTECGVVIESYPRIRIEKCISCGSPTKKLSGRPKDIHIIPDTLIKYSPETLINH